MNVWTLIVLGLVGACAGSFSSTVGLRLAGGQGWASGRSRCDHCAAKIPYTRSIPVLSYAASLGRGQCCNGPINALHLAAELAGAALLPACVLIFDPLRGGLVFALTMLLLATSIVDAKTLRLPDPITAVVALVCGGLAAVQGWAAFLTGLAAAATVVVLLEGLRAVGRRRRQEPGLGAGDVKLLAALAIWLGAVTPWAVVLAACSGLVMMFIRKPADGRLPFGPFIASGGLAVGFWRDAAGFGLVA